MNRTCAAGAVCVFAVAFLLLSFSANDFYTGNALKTKVSEPLTKEEQDFLLGLSRSTLEGILSGRGVPVINETLLAPRLLRVQGCFVTLNKQGSLRGCIGHILPRVPLYQCVLQNSVSAALYDSRFHPVRYDELKDIDIEISVLSVPETLHFSSPEELLSRLRPGTDGVVLHYQGRTSTYLPQVWESLTDKEEFLTRLCMKQSSPPDCWRRPGLEVETYQAFVFDE